MEGLKILEDEQRKFFETGAKISLVEEKDKSIKNKIDDLNLEKDKIIKNLSNLKDSEKSESDNKTDVPKDYEGDLKLKVQNEVSNLNIKNEEAVSYTHLTLPTNSGV